LSSIGLWWTKVITLGGLKLRLSNYDKNQLISIKQSLISTFKLTKLFSYSCSTFCCSLLKTFCLCFLWIKCKVQWVNHLEICVVRLFHYLIVVVSVGNKFQDLHAYLEEFLEIKWPLNTVCVLELFLSWETIVVASYLSQRS
jgi:hypothetical protein